VQVFFLQSTAYEEILKCLGYPNVQIAHDGVEAVEMSSARSYDIILMDVVWTLHYNWWLTIEHASKGRTAVDNGVPSFCIQVDCRIREREISLDIPRSFICGKPIF